MRCASFELDQWITQQIEGFSLSLCQQSPNSCRSGRVRFCGKNFYSSGFTGVHYLQLTLEFYEKKGRWLLPAEITNWEVWHLQLLIFDPASEEGGCGSMTGGRDSMGGVFIIVEWQRHQQQLADQLREKVGRMPFGLLSE